GFDSDSPAIFDQQIEFIERAAIPEAMVGLLHALPGTPLAERLHRDGRIKPIESLDQFGGTNIPTILPAAALLAGYRRILQTIYEPATYFSRVKEMMRRRPKLIERRGWFHIRNFVAAGRAMTTQGLLSHYRAEYWRFLRDVWRWNRSRTGEAILRA